MRSEILSPRPAQMRIHSNTQVGISIPKRGCDITGPDTTTRALGGSFPQILYSSGRGLISIRTSLTIPLAILIRQGWLHRKGHQYTNPDKWNDPDHVHTNNCYSYACDRLHPSGPPHAPQPGEASGHPYTGLNCDAIKVAAKADYGLKDAAGGPCPCGTNRVLLFIGDHVHRPSVDEDLGPDYHWYREDSNGKWSSKHGLTPVGPQISDPNQDAQAWGYVKPCGVMCAPNH
jgi:hypothetical protein